MVAWLLAAYLGIEPAGPLLEWDAPDSCVDERVVAARLEQLIPGERPQTLTARAVVTKTGDRYRMRVELVSATGTSVRELESESCAVLAEAAAFVVAVAIDPAVATTAMSDDAIAEPEVASEAAPSEAAPSETAPTHEPAERSTQHDASVPELPRELPRRSPRIGGVVRAAIGVGTAEVSRFDLAPSLWGAIRGRYWRAELGARYVAGRDRVIEGEAELALDAVGGVARGCGVAPAGPIEIPICAGLDLLAVRGRPRGLDDAKKRAIALRVAIDLAVALAWPLTRRVALWVEAAGGFALLRPHFTVRDTPGTRSILGTPASFSALVGVELRFGGPTR
ncbi:MAG TPA: hypothetical protein VG755_29575 [Nannocystaceae bacterium]|nr:hypothetical protein [Nannocystaceae bacterium]